MFTVVYDTMETGVQVMRFTKYEDAMRYSSLVERQETCALYGVIDSRFEKSFLKTVEWFQKGIVEMQSLFLFFIFNYEI